MENTETAEEKVQHFKEYVEVQVQIIKLKAADKASGIASLVISNMIIAVVAAMASVILSVAAGFYFSYLVGSYTKGFLIVGGFYFLLVILLLIFRGPLLANGIRNKILAAILS